MHLDDQPPRARIEPDADFHRAALDLQEFAPRQFCLTGCLHPTHGLPFTLDAFPVRDLSEARAFYGELLGCPEGRSADLWIDFDFFGHQIVAHLSPNESEDQAHNVVDGEDVPVRHFGVIVSMEEWRALARKLNIRFEGLPGEQATFFVLDPSGNALEFKAFADDAQVFAR